MSIDPTKLPPMTSGEAVRFHELRGDGFSLHEARVAAFRERRIRQAGTAVTWEQLQDLVLSILTHGV